MDTASDAKNGNGKVTHLEELSAVFDKFESSIPLLKNGNEHLKLPHFNGNKNLPIHRWYIYKEGFSAELLTWVCEITGLKLNSINSILDPFVGVATSLLSAQLGYRGQNGLDLVGVERNPFSAFVARTKLSWPDFNTDRIQSAIPKMIGRLSQGTNSRFEVPVLSTLNNERVFDEAVMQNLLFAREVIRERYEGSPEYPFFLLGWLATIEAVSNVRKDGRALRFVTKEDRPPVIMMLCARWYQMLDDVIFVRNNHIANSRGQVKACVHEGDGRTLEMLDEESRFDLILYSPPYLNNLDYSEVYKLELWMSGSVTNYKEFRDLRAKTFRSHPSYKFDETDLLDGLPGNTWPRRLRDSILRALPHDHYREARRRTIRGYMDDTLTSLKAQFGRMRDGGFAVCVVGNSIHGNSAHPIPIPTDLLITSLARKAGFKVVKVQATRHTKRRKLLDTGSRESAIVLQKPKNCGT